MTQLDLTEIDTLAAGDTSVRREILTTLIDEMAAELPRFQQLRDRADWPGLARRVHYYKSTLQYAGNAELQEINHLLQEELAREEPETERIEALLQQLDRLSRLVLEQLRSLV